VKAVIAAAVEANISPLLADRRVRPIVDRVYPLAEAADAHRRMESSAHIGKIVLTP
jgi:NADPH2:quinone reductase